MQTITNVEGDEKSKTSCPTAANATSSESFLVKAAIGGCVSAFVSASLNGFDVTKIRMQNQSLADIKYTDLIPGMRTIFREEGFGGLTKGIYPSMLREISYSSVRIGGYEPVRIFLTKNLQGNHSGHSVDTSPLIKYLSALLSGSVGAALCNPFDLAKTTFQAELPVTRGGTSNLKHHTTWAFLSDVYKTHGVGGLYKGWATTSARAGVLTSAQLGSYDTIKNNLLKKRLGLQEGFLMHLSVSMTVGVITTTAANPFDVIKTRYLADSTGKYKSIADCIVQLSRAEGVRGFFKGWVPAYWRIGPHTVMTLLLVEKVRLLFGLNTL